MNPVSLTGIEWSNILYSSGSSFLIVTTFLFNSVASSSEVEVPSSFVSPSVLGSSELLVVFLTTFGVFPGSDVIISDKTSILFLENLALASSERGLFTSSLTLLVSAICLILGFSIIKVPCEEREIAV